jgi:hypothetical protein
MSPSATAGRVSSTASSKTAATAPPAKSCARACVSSRSAEARLLALRATLDASIAQGGEVTEDELDAALAARSAELRSAGKGA